MKRLFIIVLLLTAASAYATTRTAASCSSADVQTQVSLSATNDTVIVPAGTCTWTTGISPTTAISIIGTSTNITLSGTDFISFDYHIASGFERVSGFNLSGSSSAYAVLVQGRPSNVSLPEGMFRIDHMTFTNLTHRAILIGGQNDTSPCYAITGLIDHVTWTQSNSIPGIQMLGCNEQWFFPNTPGSGSAVYIEDSSFTYTGGAYNSSAAATDCEHGCRFVIRHSTVNTTWFSTHDTGSTPEARSTRWKEIYANTATCTGGCGNFVDVRGGSGVIYDNNVAMDVAGVGANGFNPMAFTENYRDNFSGGLPWDFQTGANTHKVCNLSFQSIRIYNPSDWSVCYSLGANCVKSCTVNSDCGNQNRCSLDQSACTTAGAACGAGSAGVCVPNHCISIDGSGAGGYPSRDQVGVGPDDLTSANDPQTGGADPMYFWNNLNTRSGNALITSPVTITANDSPYISANRDFYVQGSSFDGTSGVGRGTLAARPSTCTSGVAYWETDNNRLDKCTATNTWTNGIYTAYTYPHPLLSSDVSPGVTLLPTSFDFGGQIIGTTSSSQPFVLTNISTGTINISSISFVTGNTTQFTQTNDCPGSLTASTFCTISVSFSPPNAGAKATILRVASNAINSPTDSILTGTGIIASSSINGATLNGVTVK